MQITELWLEDLFKIYLGSTVPLDRGPFQGRLAAYNPAAFGNPTPQQLQRAIEQKLRLKRQQGDVAVMGHYIRFVNRLLVNNESRQGALLRNWIRYPRVLVADNGEYDSARHALIMALSAYEARLWADVGSRAELMHSMGDRGGIQGYYSGGLDSFNRAIREFTRLATESILDCPAHVKMEVDFEVDSGAVGSMTASPHPLTLQGAQAALRAWNALFPRQRSAAVNRSGELSDALQEKYLNIHETRGLFVP